MLRFQYLNYILGQVVRSFESLDGPRGKYSLEHRHAGVIDEQVEGVYMLDFLTGDLQCLVLNPRTGTFNGQFAINVIKVLGVDQQKKPRYLMVTGSVGWIGMAGIFVAVTALILILSIMAGFLFESRAHLDAIVSEAGGRIYAAKDARMPRCLFESGYTRLDEFVKYRDPGISSAMSRRLMGS